MKTTIDIPEKVLAEAIRHTRAKTKRQAILTAVERYNQLQRLAALDARIRGSFKDFMTQADLKIMRQNAQWEAQQ